MIGLQRAVGELANGAGRVDGGPGVHGYSGRALRAGLGGGLGSGLWRCLRGVGGGAEAVDRVGRPLHDAGRGQLAGLVRRDRAAQGPGQERGDAAPRLGRLVQPAVAEARHDYRLHFGRAGGAAGRAGRFGDERQVVDRNSPVVLAVQQQERAAVARGGHRRAGVVDRVAARDEQHGRGQGCQRRGDEAGDAHPGQLEGEARHPDRVRRGRDGDDRPNGRLGGARGDHPGAAHRVADAGPRPRRPAGPPASERPRRRPRRIRAR